MKIELKDSNFHFQKDIFIKKDENELALILAGNDDFYVRLSSSNKSRSDLQKGSVFLIQKNDVVFYYFKDLFDNIVNCNIYKPSEFELMRCDTEEKKNELMLSKKIMNDYLKQSDVYKRLVEDGNITIFSDDNSDEKANILKIKQEENCISLYFEQRDEDPISNCDIRISNSGSKLSPFNSCFMGMFNQMQDLENTKEREKLSLNF